MSADYGRVRRIPDPRKGKYGTPAWLFNPLHRLLRFTLDISASKDNAKCAKYFDIKANALRQQWRAPTWWGNPPYGQDPSTGDWVEYAYEQIRRWHNRGCLLIPTKSDTAWYNDFVWGPNRVHASANLHAGDIRGRWYQLQHREFMVELLELRGRVMFEERDLRGRPMSGSSGFFASSVVLLNAGSRPVLPQLERIARLAA